MVRYLRQIAASVRLTLAVLVLAMLAASCGEAPPAQTQVSPAASPTRTGEVIAAWYQQCWAHFNTKNFDALQNCYAPDATSETVDSTQQPPLKGRSAIMDQARADVGIFSDRRGYVTLVLQHGPHVVSLATWTATNDGPMPGPDGKPMPATKKKIGLPLAHTLELDAAGTVAVRESLYIDEATTAAQLGLSPAPARPVMAGTDAAPVVAVSRGGQRETDNMAAIRSSFDAFNAHDLAKLETFYAPTVKMVEAARPTDMDRAGGMASAKEMFGGFPDVRATLTSVWAAGDYVVVAGSIAGTNTGDMPSMGIKKTGKPFSARFLEVFKLVDGKVTEDYLFYNGAAFAAQLGLK